MLFVKARFSHIAGLARGHKIVRRCKSALRRWDDVLYNWLVWSTAAILASAFVAGKNAFSHSC